MTARNPLRGQAAQDVGLAERPLSDATRELSEALASQPRRLQAWIRFDAFPLAGQVVVAPYSCAAILVLNSESIAVAGSGLTASPWLSIEPADGVANAYRIVTSYGLPSSGAFDCLVEFVEDTSARWPRTNVTGGAP